jgi:hypothetical protein
VSLAHLRRLAGIGDSPVYRDVDEEILPIGTVRSRKDGDWVKTAGGWVRVKKQKKKAAIIGTEAGGQAASSSSSKSPVGTVRVVDSEGGIQVKTPKGWLRFAHKPEDLDPALPSSFWSMADILKNLHQFSDKDVDTLAASIQKHLASSRAATPSEAEKALGFKVPKSFFDLTPEQRKKAIDLIRTKLAADLKAPVSWRPLEGKAGGVFEIETRILRPNFAQMKDDPKLFDKAKLAYEKERTSHGEKLKDDVEFVAKKLGVEAILNLAGMKVQDPGEKGYLLTWISPK